MIRFIHAADLHLDRPFAGLSELPRPLHERIKESTFKALERLTDITLEEHADFLILAGDIFDDSHRSLTAQRRFIKAMKRLDEAAVPVYLAFGNHDHQDDPWNRLKLPENVHVFPTVPAMIPFEKADGQRVHLYGFSYGRREVAEDMAVRFTRIEGADYHIGVLHGALKTHGKDTYAPFSIDELDNKAFDYWALGHIHKRMQLASPLPAWYPGSTQGLSVKETGEKGVSLVELDGRGAHVRFLPTADILWGKKEISLKTISADALETAVAHLKEEERRDGRGVFLQIGLSVSETNTAWSKTQELVRELVGAMNDEEEREDFVWLMPGRIKVAASWNLKQILDSPHFIGDVFRLIESEDGVAEALGPLYRHRPGRRFLDMPDDERTAQIRREAEQLLAEALLPE